MPRARTKSMKPDTEPYPDPHSPRLDIQNLEIGTDSEPDTKRDIKPREKNKEKESEIVKDKDRRHRRAAFFTPEIRALAVEWACEKIKDEHLAELGAYLSGLGHDVPHKSIYKQFVAGGGLRKKLVAAAEGKEGKEGAE